MECCVKLHFSFIDLYVPEPNLPGIGEGSRAEIGPDKDGVSVAPADIRLCLRNIEGLLLNEGLVHQIELTNLV